MHTTRYIGTVFFLPMAADVAVCGTAATRWVATARGEYVAKKVFC